MIFLILHLLYRKGEIFHIYFISNIFFSRYYVRLTPFFWQWKIPLELCLLYLTHISCTIQVEGRVRLLKPELQWYTWFLVHRIFKKKVEEKTSFKDFSASQNNVKYNQYHIRQTTKSTLLQMNGCYFIFVIIYLSSFLLSTVTTPNYTMSTNSQRCW